MKFKRKSLILLFIPSILLGCTETPNGHITDNSKTHEHTWSEDWSYNENEHFKKCVDENCNATSLNNAHDFGEWEKDNSSETKTDFENVIEQMIRTCSVCGYVEHNERSTPISFNEDYRIPDVLPEIKFNTDSGTSFATTPTDKTDKPEVSGTYTINENKDNSSIITQSGAMKVRGNQTARFSKKGFRMKFDSKMNILGLNNGNTYKKWVLLADAKDSSLLRTTLGFYLSQQMFGEDVFVSDFAPVNLYINDQYWGVYILGEQKEVGKGRINLPKVEDGYAGTDIGYCFELDNYASKEDAKDDGDPTFKVSYKPKDITYQVEMGSSNVLQRGYTMLSDITNKETQLPYIKKQVELLYEVLYNAAVNKKAKKIENDAVVDSTDDLKTAISKLFNIQTFAEAYVFNEVACNPDIGYSSYFMSLDMSESGDKKLRFDCPWDFDSAFGIRKNCMENAKGLYVNRSTNMWLNLFYKLDFFKEDVKQLWSKYRNDFVFESAVHMIESYSRKYTNYYEQNFARWPQCMGNKSDAKTELTDNYLRVTNESQAKDLLVNWFKKRISNLDKEWGN